jgi:hypothetical protein
MKLEYTKPELTELGHLSDLTAAHTVVAPHLDATFPAGTPTSKLTYS